MGKTQNAAPKPRVAGLNELDFSTSETNVPHTYYAGIAKLPVSWFMNPIITHTEQGDSKPKK